MLIASVVPRVQTMFLPAGALSRAATWSRAAS